MKRVLVFMGLKVIELMGAAFIYGMLFGVGFLMNEWFLHEEIKCWFDVYVGYPVFGFIPFIFLLLVGLVGYGLYELIKHNWDKAGRIIKK